MVLVKLRPRRGQHRAEGSRLSLGPENGALSRSRQSVVCFELKVHNFRCNVHLHH
jgi:hypothetical protein